MLDSLVDRYLFSEIKELHYLLGNFFHSPLPRLPQQNPIWSMVQPTAVICEVIACVRRTTRFIASDKLNRCLHLVMDV